MVDRVDDLAPVDSLEINRRNPEVRMLELAPTGELTTGSCRRPAAAAGRTGQDAEQRTDRQLDSVLGPASDVLPSPLIHSDHPSLAALASLCRVPRYAGLASRLLSWAELALDELGIIDRLRSRLRGHDISRSSGGTSGSSCRGS